MKIAKALQIMTTLCVFGYATVGMADTALKLNKELITVRGAIQSTVKFDTLAVYTPAYKLDGHKSANGCTFAEDKYSPNDGDKFVKITTAQTNGQYAVSVPTKGLRGTCEYTLDTVYITVDSGKVYENISLRTKARVDAGNQTMTDIGLEPQPTVSFGDLKQIFCEFNTTETAGLCDLGDGSLLDMQYEISNSAAIYTLDIRTK
jgi:hypothetical protein